jgi:hypothetical protein
MLRIKLGSSTADLGNEKLSIVLTSPYPMMAAGQQGGNYVFNFTVPASPELKKAFLHAHRPQAKANIVKLPFVIDAGGMRFTGTAELTEAGFDAYEVFCPVGNGDFNLKAKEIRLPELDYGGDVSLPFVLFAGARLNENVFFSHANETYFEIERVVAFNAVFSNTGELNATGTTFTADGAKSVIVTFDINCQIDSNLSELRLKKNGTTVKTFYLQHDKQQLAHTLSLADGDVLSWSIFMEAIGGYEYAISGTIFSDSRISIATSQANVLIRNSAVKRYPEVSFATFPVENPAVFENWPDDLYAVDNENVKVLYNEYFKVINYWISNDFPVVMTTVRNEVEFTASNLFVPFPYIAFVVKRIASRFNFVIANNVFEDELKYAVMINHFIENSFLSDDTRALTPNAQFNLADHVPDWSVYDFLKHLCHLFGLGYEVDNNLNTITFNYLNDIIADNTYIDISKLVVEQPYADFANMPQNFTLSHEYPSEDLLSKEIKSLKGVNFKGYVQLLSELPDPGEIKDCYYVAMLNAYVVWNYDPDQYAFGWVFHGRQYTTEISSGDDAFEIATALPSTLSLTKLDTVNDPALNRVWTIPASHQPARFEGAPDMYQGNWQPTVLWYHGLKADSQSNTYPYANADVTDHNGNEINDAPFSLHLGGPRGLYNTKWKTYLNWRLTAKPIRVKIIPDHAFLKQFRFSKKLRFGGVNYLVAEARGNINAKGPEVWELLLLVV